MPDIGATLREARMRARIDISEVEAETKIRAKYLRALENEEWDLLPGPTYVKSFLRTYAESLDLDAKLLVDEYKLRHEHLSEVELQPISAAAPGRERRRQGPVVPRWLVLVLIFAGLIVVLDLLGHDDSKSPSSAAPNTVQSQTATQPAAPPPPPPAAPRKVRLQIVATGDVNVCLKAGDKTLIDGQTLVADQKTKTYSSKHLRLTLGNDAAKLVIDGRTRTVPAATDGIGYDITPGSGRRPLSKSKRPVCRP
ncbi:MAG TPA: helix-turn-helix domain-containing protein [Solirubrobacteraceae bacterium]|jgi:cytoskeletal protein RodZ|nr:helix-turn-helix domain-containing protein [Solirubrobacteraceae bacterium]